MTVIFYGNDETESQTTSQTWQTKLSKSGILREGDYFLHVNAEITGNLTNRAVGFRVLINGVERASDTRIPQVSDGYVVLCSMGLLQIPAEGTYTVELQFISGYSSQICKIRRARILVIKF